MNTIVLFVLIMYVDVYNIIGMRCSPGVQGYVQNILNDNNSNIIIQKTKKFQDDVKVLKKRKSFNPVKHRSWKLVFDEDCGMSSANRIIGGEDADLGQYPWIARIGYVTKDEPNGEPVFQCGATLISQYYVVTAAHCVANLPDNMKISIIRLGEHQTNTTVDCVEDICADEVIDIKPQNIYMHKYYSSSQNGNDIAMIRLSKPVDITEWISPICLPYGHVIKKKYTNETAEVAGWGVYELGIDTGSVILQTVKLPILNYTICAKVYETANLTEEHQMCVGGEIGKDSCTGDSGGPLMKVLAVNGIPRYYLLGVVSFGSKYCGMSSTPAIYTRITSFLEWILNNVKVYK